MAKRKKLNTRVVVLLSVFGVLVLALGVAAIIGLMPRDPEAYFDRGMSAFEQGDYQSGSRFLQEAIGQAKKQGAEKPKYYYQLARLQMEWAENDEDLTRAQQGELLGRSRGNLETALRVDESYMPAHRMLYDMRWQQARASGGAGRHWDQFIEQVNQLIEREPDNHKAIYRRAVAKSRQTAVRGEYYEQAIEDYRKAIELNGEVPRYWMDMIRLMLDRGHLVEAEMAFDEAIEANPESSEIRSFYSEYLSRRGREDEAMAQIREAVERNPDSAQPFLSLASQYRRSGDVEAAMDALEKAKEVEPQSWDANMAMARLYDQRGDAESAVAEMREALDKLAAEMDRLNAEDLSIEERMSAERRIRNSRLELNRGLGLLLVRLAQRSDDEQQSDEYLRQAEEHLQIIREMLPDSAYVAEVAGRIAEQRGDISEAMSQLEKAYEQYGTRNPRLAMDLMQLYRRRDMPGKAKEIVDRLLKTSRLSNNTGLLLTQAQLEMQFREYDKAADILQSVLRSDPENEQARNLLSLIETMRTPETATLPEGTEPSRALVMAMRQQASAAWVRGDKQEAVRILEDLHERIPEDWGVSSHLTSVYVGMDETEKARRLLEEAKEYHPDRPQVDYALKMLEETDPDKRFELALESTAVEEDPARRELSKAAVCAVFGKNEQYAEHLMKAMELDPDSPEVVGRVFQYALSREDWELAEQCVAAAEKANLDELDGKLYRAQMAGVRGRYEEVIELLEEPLQGRPDLKRGWAMLASGYLRQGRLQDAREAYREIWNIDPSFAPAAIGMARVSEQLGDEEEHRRWIERAYSLAPDNPYVRSRYLNLQEEYGDPRQAIAQREEILRRDPEDMNNIYRLAVLYERTGQIDKAEEMLTRNVEQMDEELDRAAVMASFFERTRQHSRTDELMRELLNEEDDKVGVYQLWGRLLESRNPSGAEQVFQQAIQHDSEDPRGHWSLANFYAQRNRPEQALEHFRKCVELQPENVRYRKGLMGQLINAGHYDEASDLLAQYRQDHPEDTEVLAYEGILALRQGDADKARELLDEAVDKNPGNPEPLNYRAQLNIAEGRLENASEDLERVRNLSDGPEIGVRLADVQLRMGEENSAERTLREVLERYRGYSPAINRLIAIYQQDRRWNTLEEFITQLRRRFPDDPTYLVREAEMWSARGAPDREVDAMEKAYELAPDSTQIVARYVNALLKTEQYQQVLKVTEQPVEDGDPPAWILAVRGRAQAKLGNADESERSFARAIEKVSLERMRTVGSQIRLAYDRSEAIEKLRQWRDLRPDDPLVYMLISQLHQEGREHDRAVDMLLEAEQLAETEEEMAEINKLLGPSYQALGEAASAEKAYLKYLEYRGDDPYVLNNLAYLYVDVLEEPEKALPYAEKAARQLPDNAAVLDTYGWALFKTGRTDEAERQLVQAVQLGQSAVTVRYHLGAVYEQKGRNRDALRQYRRAYEMVRNDESHELHAELKEAVDRVEDKLSG
ncbi:MAG: tetratricopeptide repeat protein [Phycisphaerae bacterium]